MKKKYIKGFTLIELLIVLSIISVLSVIGVTNYQGIQARARDSIRKSDLNHLAMALEIYSQQNNQYVGGVGTNCSSDTPGFNTAITSYMSNSTIPTDPKPSPYPQYCYISVNNGRSYTLCAKLENTSDPNINNPSGCPGFNFGLVPK